MVMLSLFPQILFLSPIGTTLLRVTAGLVFLLMGWKHYKNRDALSTMQFIVIGGGLWIPMVTAFVEVAVGITLTLGIYTQAAAIVGAAIALKSVVWKGRYPAFFPLSRTASVLLLVISLSLIMSGAGAFAFDLPL